MKGSDGVEKVQPLFYIPFLGHQLGVSVSIVTQWVIILLVGILCAFLTRNLAKVPNKKQSATELLVEAVNTQVRENMGTEYMAFVPYIGTLAIYVVLMNLTGLVAVTPPTIDYSVALGLALITFVIVQAYAIRKRGLGHYFGAYMEPYVFILPLNLIERIMLPVSLSLRLFGNMTAGIVIVDLVYKSLGNLSPFAQLIIPIPLHFYFDLFDGAVQMIIFVMLTMINIKIISEH